MRWGGCEVEKKRKEKKTQFEIAKFIFFLKLFFCLSNVAYLINHPSEGKLFREVYDHRMSLKYIIVP